jgi:hypothetical protein
MKNADKKHARLQSIDAAQLAKVAGGALWQPGLDLLVMGGCFPTEPMPEPYPLPSPYPYPIPVW